MKDEAIEDVTSCCTHITITVTFQTAVEKAWAQGACIFFELGPDATLAKTVLDKVSRGTKAENILVATITSKMK